MKLTQSSYILIMATLQMSLDIAKKENNNRKAKKLETAMQELSTIGIY